jgi:hypothetical protein
VAQDLAISGRQVHRLGACPQQSRRPRRKAELQPAMPAAAKLLGNHSVDCLGKLIGVRIAIEASSFEERPEFAMVRSKQKRPQIVGVFEGCFDLFIRAHSDYIRDTVRHVSN